jgi:hypothetical protein
MVQTKKTITCTIRNEDYDYIQELKEPVSYYIELGVKAFKADFSEKGVHELKERIKSLSLALEKALREKEYLEEP